MKKRLYLMMGLVALAAVLPFSAEAAPKDPLADRPSYAMLQEGKRRTKQPWLYLDKESVAIRDMEKDAFIVEALILEVRERGKTYGHLVTYRLTEKENQVKGLDGKWHALPENSDDPSAVAAFLIWKELGDPARREGFLTEIQQIMLRKGEVPEAAGAEITEADAAEPETGSEAESLIVQRARGSAEKAAETPAEKEKENIEAEETAAKDAPDVVISIERHEPAPAVEIEIISEKTETHDIVTSAGAET